MNNYLKPQLNDELHAISALGLAHIGDAVFELMVRTHLCTNGTQTAKKMHRDTVSYVAAKSQAASAAKILPELSEDELAVYRRGKNAHTNGVPRGASVEEYHMATGLETLFGYVYLKGEIDRLCELFDIIVREREAVWDAT